MRNFEPHVTTPVSAEYYFRSFELLNVKNRSVKDMSLRIQFFQLIWTSSACRALHELSHPFLKATTLFLPFESHSTNRTNLLLITTADHKSNTDANSRSWSFQKKLRETVMSDLNSDPRTLKTLEQGSYQKKSIISKINELYQILMNLYQINESV